jgi:hypothetical protein
MKQHILNWLSFSIIILLLFSCKKKSKGVLGDFPPGKFDFVWAWNQNGTNHTVTGEVSGPYPLGGDYSFRRKLILGENEPDFELHGNNTTFYNFSLEQSIYNARVVSYDITTNSLFLSFERGDTLTGTFNLIRK